MKTLSDEHIAMLRASAISDATIEQRGYETIERASHLRRLGFGQTQANVPALLIPVFNCRGEVVLYQSRPDERQGGEAEGQEGCEEERQEGDEEGRTGGEPRFVRCGVCPETFPTLKAATKHALTHTQ